MKAKLIANPNAGTDAAPDYLATINRRLRERLGSLDIVLTVAEGDAAQLAERAVQDGYDRVFVAGGDGTINEVLNGVARVPGGLAAVTLGVIPLGTGNDFATALGIPEDIDAAIEHLLDGEPLAVDVGRLDERFFVNVSAGGFIAEVSDAVNPQLKTIAGKLAYLIGGAQVLLDYEPVRAHVRNIRPGGPVAHASDSGSRATTDAIPSEIELQAFAVCNSQLIGGGRLIAPHARIDDGELDVCLIHSMPTVEFLPLLRRVSSGEHVGDDRVTYFRTRELELVFDRTIKINTDGEVLEADRCRYHAMPGVARFLRKPPVAGDAGLSAARAGLVRGH